MVNFKIGNTELLIVNKYSSPIVAVNFYKKCKEGIIIVKDNGNCTGPIPINITEKEMCYLVNCLDDYIYEKAYRYRLILTVNFSTFTYHVKIEIKNEYAGDYIETFSGALSEFIKTIDYINLHKKHCMDDELSIRSRIDKAIDKAIESIPNVLANDFKIAFPLLMPVIMKILRGNANPAVVQELLTNRFLHNI
jgi:hypothetical protein